MKVKALIAGFFALAASAVHAVSAEDYHVAVDLLHNNQVTASPSLVVQDGVPASVSVSGDDGYEVALTIRKQNSEFLVDTQINSAGGSIAPSFLVKASHPAKVTIGEFGLRLTLTEQP
ncbi:hypothetical protein ACFOD1_12425 [Pseudidiomarina halophila]|uniref:Uncharacterized protein n=1 Tax=Pseudidiomarina halophila TaxID=1449799 RepID=A0A432XV75_9GAMM|nr:hypothetical protein [Pseudidiomarina halophila]RUO52622.1 hypothetical protein CWI69_06175 [Pseudidiomarina halophila]